MRSRNGLPLGAPAVLLLAAGMVHRAPPDRAGGAEAGADQRRRALLVGVGHYAPGTGWPELRSRVDLALMRQALEHHRFAAHQVVELTDREATRGGVLRAFRRHLLEPAAPGDAVVFHFSGHGQQVPDDDGDELDGYDEALVPYDAPRRPGGRYRGRRHLRDDALGKLLHRLRRKVGAEGSVAVFLDSCFSGTGTRGRMVVRGAAPYAPPAAVGGAPRSANEGAGFGEPPGPGRSTAAHRGLAPMVVFAAARHDELAYEAEAADGTVAGSLSLAASRGLLSGGLGLTYRGLFREVRWEMAALGGPGRPQAEGDVDASLFGGRAVPPRPSFEVSEILRGGAAILLRPGSLAGLLPGAEVEVHGRGDSVGARQNPLASGRVVRSTPSTAEVELEEAVAPDDLHRAEVYATRLTFGDLRLRVRLDGGWNGAERRTLAAILAEEPAVELTGAEPDLLLVGRPDDRAPGSRLEVRAAATGARLAGPLPVDDPASRRLLAAHLGSLARNLYLKRLRLHDPAIHTTFEVMPVEVQDCHDPEHPDVGTCELRPLDRAAFLTPGRQLVLPLGTYFQVSVRSGPEPAFLTLLDLMPDGQVEILWPPPGAEERVHPSPGGSRLLPRLFQIVPPTGTDVLLLIATRDYLDFRPLRFRDSGTGYSDEGGTERGDSGGALGPFAPLFDDLAIRSRSRIRFRSAAVSTTTETVSVR